ncbi:MAG: type II toxin-antitoxin system VapC family toxin [Acidobacteria bacterium]|nr:type II toxin-antitoxin system VapC family toxin [Acidobacteriota bacterium]
MKAPKAFVLDSWAIMAYLEDEPAAIAIADMIADAPLRGTALLITVVNAGEVWYTMARRRSVHDADQVIRWLREIGIDLVNADMELTRIAARYKAKGGISYADCFAAALAKQAGGTLVTGDREFEQLQEQISILWL